MEKIVELLFFGTLIYLIVISIKITKAGFLYDTERKKKNLEYKLDHSGLKDFNMLGHFKIPWFIEDKDPNLMQYVSKYNRLTKVFWISFVIGIPLIIYLFNTLNRIQ